MGSIQRSKEELSRIHQRYLNDTVVQGYINLKAHIIMRSVPKFLVTDKGVTPVYDEAVQKGLDKIDEDMKDYIKATYPELFEAQ